MFAKLLSIAEVSLTRVLPVAAIVLHGVGVVMGVDKYVTVATYALRVLLPLTSIWGTYNIINGF